MSDYKSGADQAQRDIAAGRNPAQLHSGNSSPYERQGYNDAFSQKKSGQ